MADLLYNKKTQAFAGYLSIAGAVFMLIGAAFWAATGTDLWQALADDQMEPFLSQLPPVKQLFVINTFFWVIGALFMAIAGSLMGGFCISNPALARMGMELMRAAAPLAIVSFISMLSLPVLDPSVDAATITGWIGARLDDIATTLIVGFGPLCLSIAGKADWIPQWLALWGYLAGFTGLLAVLGMLTGVFALGFIIIPVGIGWMMAAGVMLVKRSRSVVEN